MKKYLSIFILSSNFLFSAATCRKDEILGVFPKINGVGCDSYALMIGFAAGLGAYLFWEQVTK